MRKKPYNDYNKLQFNEVMMIKSTLYVELPNEIIITNNVEDQPSFNSDKFREKDENVKS